MGKSQIVILALLLTALPAFAQRVEKVSYGDFESWAVRHIKESAIVGGETKTIYAIGPNETIDGNKTYDYSRTIWATSNAFAKVSGVTKTSVTVEPEDGPSGKCARLSTRFASCKVAGLVDIKVLASGAIYWGKMLEPVTGVKNPYAFMDWGIPFTKRPSALLLDCKAYLPNSGTLTRGTTFSQKEFPGKDPCQIMLILQKRWEDENGNIHALRVGTAFKRITKSSGGWVKDVRVEMIYGNATADSRFRDYMGLLTGRLTLYAINSRGVKKPIIEEGWAESGETPTHAVLQITAGSRGAFIGEIGNTLWVDNIRLEYPE